MCVLFDLCVFKYEDQAFNRFLSFFSVSKLSTYVNRVCHVMHRFSFDIIGDLAHCTWRPREFLSCEAAARTLGERNCSNDELCGCCSTS